MQLKDCLWQKQAEQMGRTVHELKTWYNSHRKKSGRLKQAAKKSGQGDEGFSATDQWVWDNFQFLVAHIIDTERRNVVSFKYKLNSATAPSTSGTAPVFLQSSSGSEGDTPAPTLPLQAPPKLPSSTYDDTDTIGTMLKEFLAKKSTATPSTAGACYFALYVETILKQLSGSLRREAEHRIQQVLHDVEYKAETQRSQQGVTQQQCQQQSQGYQNWQPHPSQWPTQLTKGHSPSVWQSQDRQWLHNQFPQHMYTSSPPMTKTSETLTVARSSNIQGKTYADLEPVGGDMVSQTSFDLSAVVRDAGIQTDLEDDHQRRVSAQVI